MKDYTFGFKFNKRGYAPFITILVIMLASGFFVFIFWFFIKGLFVVEPQIDISNGEAMTPEWYSKFKHSTGMSPAAAVEYEALGLIKEMRKRAEQPELTGMAINEKAILGKLIIITFKNKKDAEASAEVMDHLTTRKANRINVKNGFAHSNEKSLGVYIQKENKIYLFLTTDKLLDPQKIINSLHTI